MNLLLLIQNLQGSASPPVASETARVGPYPTITFQVDLSISTQLSPSPDPTNIAYSASLREIFIPYVGMLRHGDQFTVSGVEARRIKGSYEKIGQEDSSRRCLTVLSVA
jgi:hypothetical protein